MYSYKNYLLDLSFHQKLFKNVFAYFIFYAFIFFAIFSTFFCVLSIFIGALLYLVFWCLQKYFLCFHLIVYIL